MARVSGAARRPPSVATLGTALLKACARGDHARATVLTDELVDIACGRRGAYSTEASAEAFQWLAAHDDGALDRAASAHLRSRPDLVITLVKTLLAFAQRTTDPQARRHAEQALARFGYDDASLRRDDA